MCYIYYLISLIRHKIFVLVAGLRIGGISLFRLIVHDYTKFCSKEFPQYARKYYGKYPTKREQKYKGKIKSEIDAEYLKAWEHHYLNISNSHHWQFWIRGGVPVAMFEEDLREMVADWFGASRCYTGSWNMKQWLKDNLPKIDLHPNTRSRVYEILREFGYDIQHNGEGINVYYVLESK